LIFLERVLACEEKTSQAKHVKRIIKNEDSTLIVYYKLENPSIQMDQLNFHTMSLEDLEHLKEYLLDSRNTEEAYSERADINQRILLIDKEIHNKKQQLNG